MVQYSVGLSIADLQQRAFGVRRKHPGLEEHAHGEPSTGTGSKEARGGDGGSQREMPAPLQRHKWAGCLVALLIIAKRRATVERLFRNRSSTGCGDGAVVYGVAPHVLSNHIAIGSAQRADSWRWGDAQGTLLHRDLVRVCAVEPVDGTWCGPSRKQRQECCIHDPSNSPTACWLLACLHAVAILSLPCMYPLRAYPSQRAVIPGTQSHPAVHATSPKRPQHSLIHAGVKPRCRHPSPHNR